MKRVRYLIGAAGLAPAAVAMAAGHTAEASTTLAKPVATAKTVSLHHVQGTVGHMTVTQSGHLGTSSVSSPASSPDRGRTGCTGVKTAHTTSGALHLQFWYTNSGCVGTVEGIMKYNKNLWKCEFGDIVPNTGAGLILDKSCASGHTGSTLTVTWHVHQVFATPVKVCMQSTYNFHGACLSF